MAPVRSVSSYDSSPLDQGWELAELAPGAAPDPAALAETNPAWLPASARGTVAAILRAAGQWELGDARSLDDSDFWYRCRFPSGNRAADGRAYLRLQGLATVADVWLNGVPLLRSENMYVAHALDVTALLHAEPERDNELCILFHSLTRLLQAKRPRPRWRTRMIGPQQLRWIRTTLLGRMPGWCPAVAPVGPWRPVILEHRRGIDSVAARLVVDVEARRVTATLRWQPLGPVRIPQAQLIIAGVRTPLRRQESAEGGLLFTGEVHLRDAELWWPHTHGPQPLYDARTYLQLDDEAIEIDCGKVGFRQLAIYTGGTGGTDDGSDFGLRVNGVPVFCRGACWTPLDIVTLCAPKETYREALTTACAAGMNMLRLPGNLLYEDRLFHDLCDELGILVWQEFMFANQDYPVEHPDFASRVRAEATQLLESLAQSPSLAVLCGGSEVEQQAAMLGLPRQQWTSALFHELLPALCSALCPDVPYWPASPSGGELPFQVNAGVAHYYGVGAYLRPLTDARRSEVRFAAECLAFANIPEDSTLESLFGSTTPAIHHPQWKARVPRDVGAGWDFDDVRDHYLRELSGQDPMRLRYSDPARYLLLGRVVCGEVMASTFAEWRRRRSTCRGALVWLYRDLWPGAGFGLIDALGTPKSSYYYLKRTLQPLALLLSDEGLNGLYAHVINETAQRHDLRLTATLYRDGQVQIAQAELALELLPRDALEVPLAKLFPSFLDTSYAYRFGPPSHDLVVVRLLEQSTEVAIATAFFLPLGFPQPGSGELGLTARAQRQQDGSYSLVVRTEKYAQAVVISAAGFLPDDNYFHLEPGGKRVITLTPRAQDIALDGTITAVNTLTSALLLEVSEQVDFPTPELSR